MACKDMFSHVASGCYSVLGHCCFVLSCVWIANVLACSPEHVINFDDVI